MTGAKGANVADISIIVTAYNIEDYIEQCLDSVAASTLGDQTNTTDVTSSTDRERTCT